MAKKKKKNEIQKVNPSPIVAPPEFMEEDGALGTETLQEYVVLPRLKVIQRQSSDELLEKFKVGDVIITPVNELLIHGEDEESFLFTPIFFYPEVCVWNPIKLRGQEPAIRERTCDVSSPLFSKAQNASLREEPHPEYPKELITYVEHLNFIVWLYDKNEVGILSYSRAEHFVGRRLVTMCKMRKAPLFGCVFEAMVGERSNDMGAWLGIDATNPIDADPFVQDKTLYENLKKAHEEMKENHRKNLIRTSYDDDHETVDVTDSEY